MKEFLKKSLTELLWITIQAICLVIGTHMFWNTLAEVEVIKGIFTQPLSFKFDSIATLAMMNFRLYKRDIMWDSWSWLKSTIMIITSIAMFLILEFA